LFEHGAKYLPFMARGLQRDGGASALHGNRWNADEVVGENFGGLHLTNRCENKKKIKTENYRHEVV
jgi:hypothetical protein